jgi:cellulose biosynthesis protein BcsQ
MGKVIGIISGGKGCGKTTVSTFLSAALSLLHRRVTLVDLDGAVLKKLGQDEGAVDKEGIRWEVQTGRSEWKDLAADYVLVDVSALEDEDFTAFDGVIVVVEARRGGDENLYRCMQILQDHDALELVGILRNQGDAFSTYSEVWFQKMQAYFPGFIFQTEIPRNYYLAEANFTLKDKSGQGWHSGFADFLSLAIELIEHEY